MTNPNHAAYMREWRLRNPEKCQEIRRRYKVNHPETVREGKRRFAAGRSLGVLASRFAYGSNRRALRMGIPGRLTATAVRLVIGPCVYCGGVANTWDHAVALVHGGDNATSNLVPACWPCNEAKHAIFKEFRRHGRAA